MDIHTTPISSPVSPRKGRRISKDMVSKPGTVRKGISVLNGIY
jgi:hypothetical protein